MAKKSFFSTPRKKGESKLSPSEQETFTLDEVIEDMTDMSKEDALKMWDAGTPMEEAGQGVLPETDEDYLKSLPAPPVA